MQQHLAKPVGKQRKHINNQQNLRKHSKRVRYCMENMQSNHKKLKQKKSVKTTAETFKPNKKQKETLTTTNNTKLQKNTQTTTNDTTHGFKL